MQATKPTHLAALRRLLLLCGGPCLLEEQRCERVLLFYCCPML